MQFQVLLIVRHPHRAVLNRGGQVHVAVTHPRQRFAFFVRNPEDRELVDLPEIPLVGRPPRLHLRIVVRKHHDVVAFPGRTPQTLVVGSSHINPAPDVSGLIRFPQIRIIVRGNPATELEFVARIKSKRQHPHHHAGFGFRRMARNREMPRTVPTAIQIGDFQRCLINCCAERHNCLRKN